jgi:hypothetical protein
MRLKRKLKILCKWDKGTNLIIRKRRLGCRQREDKMKNNKDLTKRINKQWNLILKREREISYLQQLGMQGGSSRSDKRMKNLLISNVSRNRSRELL